MYIKLMSNKNEITSIDKILDSFSDHADKLKDKYESINRKTVVEHLVNIDKVKEKYNKNLVENKNNYLKKLEKMKLKNENYLKLKPLIESKMEKDKKSIENDTNKKINFTKKQIENDVNFQFDKILKKKTDDLKKIDIGNLDEKTKILVDEKEDEIKKINMQFVKKINKLEEKLKINLKSINDKESNLTKIEKEKYSKELVSIEENYGKENTDILNLLKELETTNNQYEKELLENNKNIEEVNKEFKLQNNELIFIQDEIKKAEGSLIDLNNQINKFNSENKHFIDEYENLLKENEEKLKSSVDDEYKKQIDEKIIIDLKNLNEEYDDNISKLNKKIEDIDNVFEKQKQDSRSKLIDIEFLQSEIKRENYKNIEKLELLEENIKNMNESKIDQVTEIETEKKIVLDRNKEIYEKFVDAYQKKFNTNLATLKSSIVKRKEELNKFISDSKDLKKIYKEGKELSTQLINEKSTELEKFEVNLKNLEDLRDDFTKKNEEISKTNKQKIDNVEKSVELTVNKLYEPFAIKKKNDLINHDKKYNDEVEELKQKINNYNSSDNEYKDKINKNLVQIEKLSESVNSKLDKKKELSNKLTLRNKDKKDYLVISLNSLKQEFEKQKEAINLKYKENTKLKEIDEEYKKNNKSIEKNIRDYSMLINSGSLQSTEGINATKILLGKAISEKAKIDKEYLEAKEYGKESFKKQKETELNDLTTEHISKSSKIISDYDAEDKKIKAKMDSLDSQNQEIDKEIKVFEKDNFNLRKEMKLKKNELIYKLDKILGEQDKSLNDINNKYDSIKTNIQNDEAFKIRKFLMEDFESKKKDNDIKINEFENEIKKVVSDKLLSEEKIKSEKAKLVDFDKKLSDLEINVDSSKKELNSINEKFIEEESKLIKELENQIQKTKKMNDNQISKEIKNVMFKFDRETIEKEIETLKKNITEYSSKINENNLIIFRETKILENLKIEDMENDLNDEVKKLKMAYVQNTKKINDLRNNTDETIYQKIRKEKIAEFPIDDSKKQKYESIQDSIKLNNLQLKKNILFSDELIKQENLLKKKVSETKIKQKMLKSDKDKNIKKKYDDKKLDLNNKIKSLKKLDLKSKTEKISNKKADFDNNLNKIKYDIEKEISNINLAHEEEKEKYSNIQTSEIQKKISAHEYKIALLKEKHKKNEEEKLVIEKSYTDNYKAITDIYRIKEENEIKKINEFASAKVKSVNLEYINSIKEHAIDFDIEQKNLNDNFDEEFEIIVKNLKSEVDSEYNRLINSKKLNSNKLKKDINDKIGELNFFLN